MLSSSGDLNRISGAALRLRDLARLFDDGELLTLPASTTEPVRDVEEMQHRVPKELVHVRR